MKKLDLLITGVGGQGVILASDIIGDAAITTGYDIKKTDALGMAQRGGSVTSNVRIAPQVRSPLIKMGEADMLLAFEKLEAARWSHYLRPGGIAIVNNHALPPLSVSLGSERYPGDDEIINILKQRTDRVYFVEGTRRARELGNVRVLNIFMLGCVSLFAPFKVQTWEDSISQHLPPKLRQINIEAFNQGRKEIQGVRL
ncbi:MAG TPA: indolepyruvate oxidoreductase subunit beta [Dehalococcoidales bacterium]|nr:indolepyruvate oxidoreductase subunit beta [Dehalococcoidales bacterium]